MAGSIVYPPLALQLQVLQDDEHEYVPTSEQDGLVANRQRVVLGAQLGINF
jgi:hypothetical protein